MENRQKRFEATAQFLLEKFPRERENKYDNEEWVLYETYIPQVLALAANYNDSQSKPDPLIANMDFVNLLVNAANWLGMAIGAQERYDESLELLRKAEEILDGPAGDIPTRKMVWRFNTSRNYYCMGKFQEAEALLSKALEQAEALGGWYQLVYAHLTFSSLKTRIGQLGNANEHVDIAKHIIETSGLAARFSWLSSYTAYRAGDVAMKQGRVKDAIEEMEKATIIGKLVKAPIGILCRCIHAYSKALAMDPTRAEEAEHQRQEARRLRAQIPGDSGDLDDESDQVFERLVKMDHR
ncbi:hypothetical protein ONZ43_g173 [Nemania bipapillata]|uniref:Uncharacterized protein n=1 Tax=Nemania bipapillata TaxID=110536 RepID=A0ACC2J9E3_9PEZI|nr:hypothetical protein ONZ43_g173 [Nemania bipapillata]